MFWIELDQILCKRSQALQKKDKDVHFLDENSPNTPKND